MGPIGPVGHEGINYVLPMDTITYQAMSKNIRPDSFLNYPKNNARIQLDHRISDLIAFDVQLNNKIKFCEKIRAYREALKKISQGLGSNDIYYVFSLYDIDVEQIHDAIDSDLIDVILADINRDRHDKTILEPIDVSKWPDLARSPLNIECLDRIEKLRPLRDRCLEICGGRNKSLDMLAYDFCFFAKLFFQLSVKLGFPSSDLELIVNHFIYMDASQSQELKDVAKRFNSGNYSDV